MGRTTYTTDGVTTMAEQIEDVESQVGLAALLDTGWFQLAMLDPELVRDATLWPSGGALADVLALHPFGERLVEAAVTSPRPHVRATVASRRDLDPEVYALLGSDAHPTVRTRIAANPSTPGAVIGRLCRDEDELVRETAFHELCRRQHWCDDEHAGAEPQPVGASA
jgi:hypothetical protein